MYYAKFTNGQVLQDKWQIQVSNNIVLLTNGTDIIILKEGVLKDDYVYLPLEEDRNFYYCEFLSGKFSTSFVGSSAIHSYEEKVTNFKQTIVTDNEFSEVGLLYYYIVGYTTTSSIVFLKNPTQMYTYPTISASSSTYKIVPKVTTSYSGGSSTSFTAEFNLSTIALNLVQNGTFYRMFQEPTGETSPNVTYNKYFGGIRANYTSRYGTFYAWQMLSLAYISTNITYIYQNPATNYEGNYNPLGIYDLLEQGQSITVSSGVSGINFKITNDYDNTKLKVYQFKGGLLIKAVATNDVITLDNAMVLSFLGTSTSSTANSVWTGLCYYDSSEGDYYYYCVNYQYPYTPTNKLKTPTFSDLNVLHNEDTGTYALTFKANNPNDVSVSVDINISGREGTDTITLPSGDSEWSFALSENKAGTLQGTNINALGYENADDTSKYNYYEWVAPGYLRELVMPLCYLSTIDDKTYTLNISVENPNSVNIPCVIHYGKNGEYTMSKTLKSSLNFFIVENAENINGIVWIHPEKVDGYYQLPDTDAVSYTKLPIPPTPSSTGITLYKNNNNNKVVNKGYKLETYKVLNGTFRDSVNILNPVFQIENDEVPECNYCYIADFRRYYYIDTITCIRTGLYEIECSVDVLYTYKDSILNSEQYISRQENEYNELLKDDMVTFDSSYDYNIYYQNIDELDYGIATGEVMKDYDRTNILVSWFGIQS